MESILELPVSAYRYIRGEFGTIGLIIVGLLIAVGIIAIMTWWDRRK